MHRIMRCVLYVRIVILSATPIEKFMTDSVGCKLPLKLARFCSENQELMNTLYLQCFVRHNSFINVHELVQQSKFSNLYDIKL